MVLPAGCAGVSHPGVVLVPLGEALVRQRRLGGMIGLALTNYAFIESAVAATQQALCARA